VGKIGSSEFENRLKSSEYVIIDFSSPWCAPCKKVPPILEKVTEELKEIKISAFELSVVDSPEIAHSPEIAQKYFILGVPTTIIFKNGKEIKRFNSIPKKDKIIKVILKSKK
jgi:thioredoxin 1